MSCVPTASPSSNGGWPRTGACGKAASTPSNAISTKGSDHMPVAADAVLKDDQGRSVLRFERALRHPPQRGWQPRTERGEFGSWHPPPLEFEPVAGGKVSYLSGGDVPEMPDGVITEYDPPRVLAHTWGEDQLRWELRP